MKKHKIHPSLNRWAHVSSPYRHLMTGILLIFLFVLSCPAWARRYTPPSGDPPDGSFGSNGSRGCGDGGVLKAQTEVNPEKSIPLTLLAPLQHVGQTTTTTPTLAWFVPAKNPYRVQISLYAFNADQSTELLHELEYVETASGVVQYTLPEDKSELQVGQRYQIQLSLACNPSSDSFDQFFVAELDVKESSPTLVQALTQAKTSKEKAELYANSGFWFDAIREMLAETDRSKSSQQIRTFLQELAEFEENTIHRQALVQIAELLNDSNLPTAITPLKDHD